MPYTFELFQQGPYDLDATTTKLLKAYLKQDYTKYLDHLHDSLHCTWWAVARETTNTFYNVRLYCNEQEIYRFSARLDSMDAWAQSTEAQIEAKLLLYETSLKIKETFDFVDIPVRAFKEAVQRARQSQTKTSRWSYYLVAAILVPFAGPVRLAQQILTITNVSRVLTWALKKLQSKHINNLYYASFAFFVVTLCLYANENQSTVTNALSAFAATFAAVGMLRKSDTTRDISLALSIELWVEMSALTTAEELVATAILFVFLFILNQIRNDVKILWVIAWVFVRILRAAHYGSTAEMKWNVSQLLLALLVLTHMTQRFMNRARYSTATKKITYDLPAKWAALTAATVLVTIHIQYTQKEILPESTSILYLIIPICYILSSTIPFHPIQTRRKEYINPTSGLLHFVVGTVSLACTVVALTASRDNQTTVYSADTIEIQHDPCNSNITNMHICKGNYEKANFVFGQCCLHTTYVQLNLDNYIRSALKETCEDKLALSGYGYDCCGNYVLPDKAKFVAGIYGCVCNGHPLQQNENTLHESGEYCVCDEDYSGVLCEVHK